MASNTETNDELISNFCSITGVEASRGQFYLESAQWNLQLAIQSFFEHSEDIPMDTQSNPIPTSDEGSGQQSANQPIIEKVAISEEEVGSVATGLSPSTKQPKSSTKAKKSSNFATLDSLKTDSGASSEEEGQAFYAGGSERSGQQVLGPKKKNSDELVSNMFASAKAHGAEVVDPSDETKVKKTVNAFVGTGFKLGSNAQDSATIPSTTSSAQKRENREMVLKLWRNGFSLDSGALRDYKDPQNQEFLNSIHNGEIPRELIQKAGGQEVHLNMEDHRNEQFVPQKQRLEAFSGEGHRLGNPSADVVSSAVSESAANIGSEVEALRSLNVDETKPKTRIQIRLSDGTRLVLNINHTHTIAHIRHYITTVRPAYAAQPFVLMTTFPNKELTDETLSLTDASLLNASIVQKLQ